VTFVTKDRRQLPEWARGIVLDSCIHGHDRKYNLRVALVMPDHAHLILTPLTDLQRLRIFSLHEILQGIKSFSARRINEHLGRRGQAWQRESFDHVLRCSESLDAKIAYVLANPVRAGLVRLPEEYPWKWEKPVAAFRPM
jgi:REP element-mobilizing transposase RayT